MHWELLITNIGFTVSFVVCLGLGILAFVRRPATGATANIVFFLSSLAFCTWQASYALGINLHDAELSRLAFMFNLATILVVILNTHLILTITDRVESQKHILTIFYTIGISLILYFALFPDTFLLSSTPQSYFPNFFVPGPLYVLQDCFFFGALLYFFIQMVISYHRADYRMRNRLKYFILALLYAYIVGLIPEFLLYGINIDPLPACLVGLYAIPMAYGILKYDVFDINFLAKRAFGYALSIATVTLFIFFIGYGNQALSLAVPSFPQWLLPLISALIAVVVGVIVWKKIKEVDELKYQFVDVVTHKFRTPLTHIKWSLENLRVATSPEDRADAMTNINDAHTRLFQLTDMLIGLSSSENSQFLYTYERESIRKVIDETADAISDRLREKRVTLEVKLPDDIPDVHIDHRRIQFAVQMVMENAVTYSQEGGTVIIAAEYNKEFITLSVHDFGIGITKEDMARIFAKFFRSDTAMLSHTEGLGIGLHISRDILRRHGGDLKAASEGPGKGSTFSLKIPVART